MSSPAATSPTARACSSTPSPRRRSRRAPCTTILRGTRTEVAVRRQWAPAAYTMAEGWERTPAQQSAGPRRRRSAPSSLEIIEESFPANEARRQASRCLRCNVNTVFDTSICVACNGCVDVCPENLIRLVGLSELCKEDRWLDMVSSSLEVSRDDLRRMDNAELDALGGVMIKDETTCIRCAMCASRCPTHAITMKKFEFYRECVTVPTRNEKILYEVAGTTRTDEQGAWGEGNRNLGYVHAGLGQQSALCADVRANRALLQCGA